jgi:hypothetical protein
MTTTLKTVDWVICLAWSLGHAILTALVRRTAVNAAVTFDEILLSVGAVSAHRWVGRCAVCRKAQRVDGVLTRGRRGGCDETVVVSSARVYSTAGHGSNPTVLFISCCDGRVKLQRVYDDARPGRPRHECNAKCLASTGPACECKCRGANHGACH